MDAIEALEAELAAEPYAGLRYMLAINDDELLRALVALRKARGLTREQVAERMNRSVSVVADFERPGVDPHLSTIKALRGGDRCKHRNRCRRLRCYDVGPDLR